MTNSVVITRPVAQAESLARRVAALGREVVVFPLLEIHPLPDTAALRAALNDLNKYAMVAFVSPNAIHAVFEQIKCWPPEVALAVVGEGSRATLAEYGLDASNATIYYPRDPARTDSQTLLEVLDLEALRGRQALIVRGETGRELLADALRGVGVQVIQVAAYRRAAPELDIARRSQLQALLDSQNDWIVTSSEALGILLKMVENVAGNAGVAIMQQQHLIVPHVRIAEIARKLQFQHITLTGSGDERLLAALQSPI